MKERNKIGKFITIDGVDGCGKGTQLELLTNYLFKNNKKNSVFLTREPFSAEKIRQLLKKNTADPKDNAETLMNLFIEDRCVHAKIIENLLKHNVYVVCDRYKYSTLAYQQAQGIFLQKLLKIHEGILIYRI